MLVWETGDAELLWIRGNAKNRKPNSLANNASFRAPSALGSTLAPLLEQPLFAVRCVHRGIILSHTDRRIRTMGDIHGAFTIQAHFPA